MNNVIIIDHRQGQKDTRYVRLSECLKSVGAEPKSERQVYGEPELPIAPAGFNADLLDRTSQTLAGADLVLLHCGDGQHLVPAVLSQEPLLNIPCLLFTGGDPHSKAQEVSGVSNASTHVVLPRSFGRKLPEDWPQSRDGIALGDCVKTILSGVPPKDAVRAAFGDPKLDNILDGLYQKLNAGPENVDLRAIRGGRDVLLEGHYKKTRGWSDPAFEREEA